MTHHHSPSAAAHVALTLPTAPPPLRRLYCNRTLNLRSIKVIGYDMDYTLVDYHVEEWERRAYERARDKFAENGWPVSGWMCSPVRRKN